MVKYKSEKGFEGQRPIKTQPCDTNQIRVFPPYALLPALKKLRSFREKPQLKALTPSKPFRLDKITQEKENKIMAHLPEVDKLKK